MPSSYNSAITDAPTRAARRMAARQHHEGRTPTHGNEPTREATMARLRWQ